jgi:hypothetical protein
MTKKADFSGVWHFAYWYPSNEHPGEDISEYDMQAFQMGDQLVLESVPCEDESYMFVRLTVEGDLATGMWYETTSPHGSFGGMTYSGAGQMILSSDKQSMKGRWAGMGVDQQLGKRRIYTGKWTLVKSVSDNTKGASTDFSGFWLSDFRDDHTRSSLHYVTIKQKDNELMIGGIPRGSNSSIVLRLTLDGLIGTGTWQEHFVKGDGKGTIRHGSVQLLIDPIKKRLSGKWVGFGDGLEVGTGIWEFSYIGNKLSDTNLADTD